MISGNWIGYSIMNWLIITTLINWRLMGFPVPRFCKKTHPLEYTVSRENRIEIQDNLQCAAFSSAYLMRHFGIEADGNELYKSIPNKRKSGYVCPKGIVTLLKRYGFKATYCRGTISCLKRKISEGTPVIAFIKVRRDKNWLHYVPIIGYDETNFYLAESLSNLINIEKRPYNRIVPIKEFRKLWNTVNIKWPLYQYTYIEVSGLDKVNTTN